MKVFNVGDEFLLGMVAAQIIVNLLQYIATHTKSTRWMLKRSDVWTA